LYGAGSSGSCGVLDGAFTVVFRAVLERLIFLKVLLGYEAGHLLREQRTLETKEVTRRGLFLAS
jgi:hypothetical protein